MTIQSDIWIEAQCQAPKYVITDRHLPNKIVQYFAPTSTDELELVQFRVKQNWSGLTLREARPEDLVDWKPMIEPFSPEQIRIAEDGSKAISHGLSSFGYDVRCGEEFEIFTNVHGGVVDPKHFDKKFLHSFRGPVCTIPPNSFALARTIEWFKIPRDVLTICLGKSTYARCGIIVNVTPLEPEWEGQVTLEFSNTTSLPANIYANEGVAQMLFLKGDQPCRVSYKDRDGKYQGQSGVTLPRS